MSFHETTLPIFTAALSSLRALLQKATSHTSANSTPSDPLTWRLAPNMLPLSFQIHEVTFTSAQLVARAHDTPAPTWSHEDLHTLNDAFARIAEAEEWLAKADAEVFEKRKDERVVVGVLALGIEKGEEVSFRGWVAMYAVPTVFFHLSIAYGILREKGVEVGKRDYIGAFAAPWVSV